MTWLSPHQKGWLAEYIALGYLIVHNHRLIAHRYRSVYGELDLITLKCNTLYITEVRSRQHQGMVSACTSITPTKIRRIYQSAQHYHAIYYPELTLHVQCILITWQPWSFALACYALTAWD